MTQRQIEEFTIKKDSAMLQSKVVPDSRKKKIPSIPKLKRTITKEMREVIEGAPKKRKVEKKVPERAKPTLAKTPSHGESVAECVNSGNGEMETATVTKEQLMELASGLRELRNRGDNDDINTLERLVDMDKGTVLEVYSAEIMGCEDDKWGALGYLMTKQSGVRHCAKVSVPLRFVEPLNETNLPCVMVYMGKNMSKRGGYAYHTFQTINTVYHCLPKKATHRDIGDYFRKMTFGDMEELFRIKQLKEFPNGTIFAFDDVRVANSKNPDIPAPVVIVSYRVVMESHNEIREQGGELYLPSRMMKQAQTCAPGILIYKGEKISSKTGFLYRNVDFITAQSAKNLIDRANSVSGNPSEADTIDMDFCGDRKCLTDTPASPDIPGDRRNLVPEVDILSESNDDDAGAEDNSTDSDKA